MVIGLVIVATISNGFVLLNISPLYRNIIKGGLMDGALALDSVLQRHTPANYAVSKTEEREKLKWHRIFALKN